MSTKKGFTTARFGPKYGTKTKKKIAEMEKLMRSNHECPRCRYKQVHRIAMGIWLCDKCGLKFAGGAYMPKSETVAVQKESKEQEVVA